MADQLLVVGGGITGLALAVHGARAGLRVRLVEAGQLGGTRSTQRSGALVRTHYADAGSAVLALTGLEHFERFAEHYGAGAGFVRTGFAYVPEPHEDLGRRVAMLRDVGVTTQMLTPAEMRARDPVLRLGDVDAVAWEPRSGYASPARTCATLAAAALRAGAVLHDHRPVANLSGKGGGVGLADGSVLRADRTVLCAGAASARLAATVGLALPIRPTAVKLAILGRRVASHATLIDAPNGIYLRPDGTDGTLVGRRTWTDEPLEDADAPLPEVDAAFVADARERLARRLPSSVGAPLLGARAGLLDMTPDGLALVGPTPVEGLWLCCGWSGTGFKTAPAVGAALAAWLRSGDRPAVLAGFDPAREMRAGTAARSPH